LRRLVLCLQLRFVRSDRQPAPPQGAVTSHRLDHDIEPLHRISGSASATVSSVSVAPIEVAARCTAGDGRRYIGTDASEPAGLRGHGRGSRAAIHQRAATVPLVVGGDDVANAIALMTVIGIAPQARYLTARFRSGAFAMVARDGDEWRDVTASFSEILVPIAEFLRRPILR
jgi:hypothetical protein